MERENVQKNKRGHNKFLSMAAALVIAGFLLLSGYRNVNAGIEDGHWDVIVLGDSIIGKERDRGSVV